MAGKAARKPKSPGKKAERVRKEFLLLKFNDPLRVGSAVTVVGVAETLEKARDTALTDVRAGVGKFAVVEKRSVFERQQKITGTEVPANIISRLKT